MGVINVTDLTDGNKTATKVEIDDIASTDIVQGKSTEGLQMRLFFKDGRPPMTVSFLDGQRVQNARVDDLVDQTDKLHERIKELLGDEPDGTNKP